MSESFSKKIKTDPECLWMQAGVVAKKRCKTDFQCTTCHYDSVMKAIAAENSQAGQTHMASRGVRRDIISWKTKLRARPLFKRPCIHHMKGRIEFRICHHEYHCGNCDFDQYFDDQYSVHAVVTPVNMNDISGFKTPQGYYFHEGHTWVKIEKDSEVRVGIDDFALRLFGPFDRIEAPLMGHRIEQGRADISIFREQQHAKILSPVSGVVTSLNPKLREDGNFAGQAPYSEGWVMMVKPESLRNDLKKLMIKNETEVFLSSQVDQLYDEIETIAGPFATDGGVLESDIYGRLPGADWKRLTKMFLKT